MRKKNKNTYLNFLNYFKKIDYKFVDFRKYKSKKNIILRHDVDFSLKYALKIAEINTINKLKSHFFVLVDSPFYNLLEEENIKILNKINKLGHIIGLHYNPSSLDFKAQFEILKKICPRTQKIFSIHKFGTNKQILKYREFTNLYDKKFFDKYFADSGGKFRFGSPIEDEEVIKEKKSFQLNLHPIWWFNKDLKHQKIFKNLIKENKHNQLNSLSKYKLIKL